MVKKILFWLIVLLVIGGGLNNYRYHSKYWPKSKGEILLFSLAEVLLFILLTSAVITAFFGGLIYLWDRYKKQIFSKNELIDVYFIVLVFISVPVLWIFPELV